MSQPTPIRTWRKIALSFAGGFVLMNGVLAAVTPADAPPSIHPVMNGELSARGQVFAAEMARIYDTLDSVLLRRMDSPAFPMRPDMAAALENEVLALSDRALTAPDRVRRLLVQEADRVEAQYSQASEPVRAAMLAAHARRSDRLMADLQPIFDRRLDYLLSIADALHLARGGSSDATSFVALIADMRRKQAMLEADAPVMADLERRFGAYFEPRP